MAYKGQRSRDKYYNLLELMEYAVINANASRIDFRRCSGSAKDRRSCYRKCWRSLAKLEAKRDHDHTVESWLYDVIRHNDYMKGTV